MSVSAKQASENNTTKTFVTALVVNGALLAVEVGAFVVLKHKLGRIYSPRTYLPPPAKRSADLPNGIWRWLPAVLLSPTEDIIYKNGLDAYMFLRFIKMLIWIFLGFTIFTSLTIIPVDIVGVQSSNKDLDRISWTNIVGTSDLKRFAAHVVVVYLLTFFVFWIVYREMSHFVRKRHQFLTSKDHSRLAQARTVLITEIPDELANEQDLRQFASFVPGGVDKVWLYRDTKTLNTLFEQRQDACNQLEAAEAALLRDATKAWKRRQAIHKKTQKKCDIEKADNQELVLNPVTQEILDELIPHDERPTHRTGFWGLWGKKVDTLTWCKEEIARLNEAIATEREKSEGRFLGSAFIRCNFQIGAHVLAQCVSYHQPLTMYDKWIEAHPKDIVWRNLDDGAFEMRYRYILSWIATLGLIIGWAFPVTFIGTLSNLDDLCAKISWLDWVCTAPTPVPSIIQGVLPPTLLAILFALLPFILRGLAWYECIPRYSLISISLYRRFFLFLLVHGFLIVTLSSGITKAIQAIIDEPTQTVQQLAGQLPGASIFFLTYLCTQGLASAGGALAQLVPLILHYIRKWFLGRTPRQAYSVTFLMPSIDFGILLPRLSLLATITFAYSVVSPLINAMALISFCMFYLAFKFLCTQVFDQPDESETGGLYFPMAISNLFVGLYIEEVCLACLFFLKSSIPAARVSSIVEGALMLVLVAITACFHYYVNNSFHPITKYLPMSLATKKRSKRYEKARILQAEIAAQQEQSDLFGPSQVKRLRRRVTMLPKKMDNKLHNLGERFIPRRSPDEDFKGSRNSKEKEVTVAWEEDKPRASEQTEDQDITSAAEGAGPDSSMPSKSIPELDVKSSAASTTSLSSVRSAASSRQGSKTSHSRTSVAHSVIHEPPSLPADILSSDEEDEGDHDEFAFDHPSTYKSQPCIWIPQDTLGISTLLVTDLMDAGVDASDTGATMDKKGVVEVTRSPPDEDWLGGHDR